MSIASRRCAHPSRLLCRAHRRRVLPPPPGHTTQPRRPSARPARRRHPRPPRRPPHAIRVVVRRLPAPACAPDTVPADPDGGTRRQPHHRIPSVVPRSARPLSPGIGGRTPHDARIPSPHPPRPPIRRTAAPAHRPSRHRNARSGDRRCPPTRGINGAHRRRACQRRPPCPRP